MIILLISSLEIQRQWKGRQGTSPTSARLATLCNDQEKSFKKNAFHYYFLPLEGEDVKIDVLTDCRDAKASVFALRVKQSAYV